MSNMFGCIVSGRLVQTDFQQVGSSQFLINIPEADSLNHIVVFLTGNMPLPVGQAGAVYFSWPDPAEPPSWILLGYISNTKPSAIFKLSQQHKQCASSSAAAAAAAGTQLNGSRVGGSSVSSHNCLAAGAIVPFGGQHNVFGSQPISHIAQIGVSIEPEANVVQCTPATLSTASYVQFGQKMLENFFNYASSYATTQSQMVPNPSESFVPLSTLQNWYVNFERRLQQNPSFWKS